MLNFTTQGPAAPNGVNAPLSVRLRRFQWAANDLFRDRGIVLPRDVEQIQALSYGAHGVWNLLDVYRPIVRADSLPVLVSVHGGGYFYGDRTLYRPYCMDLARRGFAVVNFDYRLSPENRFPAPLEDLNAVLTWISAHAEEYGMDASNLFLVGDSAGAQIVSQYAALFTNPEYAARFAFSIPHVTVRAVALNCGMYDMLSETDRMKRGDIMDDYLGSDYKESGLLDVLGAITADYPPTFLLSSYHDFLLACCQPMADLLKSRGVEVISRIYGSPEDDSVGHVFHIDRRSNEGKRANADEIAFFRSHIVPKKM